MRAFLLPLSFLTRSEVVVTTQSTCEFCSHGHRRPTAVIKGWLCRIFHLSSCSEGRALAFEEAFLSLHSLVGFPKDLLARVTRDWILRWVSAKDARAVQCVRLEVERALRRLR